MIKDRSTYYFTGGTLPGNVPSYVERSADGDLFDSLMAGEFCYVLDTRQVGKSSLMVRTAARLRENSCRTVILDISSLGENLTLDQWYYGLLNSLAIQLDCEDEIESFWMKNTELGTAQRCFLAIRSVILTGLHVPLIVFVDEIDAVRKLAFTTDEFFALIRESHNRRAYDLDALRLTFCLMGVATPSDLIQDVRTTPFNIGRRIELADFTLAEMEPLYDGLIGSDKDRLTQMKRIHYWTAGHPYLSQKLCQSIAKEGRSLTTEQIDSVCQSVYLRDQSQEEEDNLKFISRQLLHDEENRAEILTLFDNVRLKDNGLESTDEASNPLLDRLLLSGVISISKDGSERILKIRNRIYNQVFNANWVRRNMPDAELRRKRAAIRQGFFRASVVWAGIAALIGIAFFFRHQANIEHINTDKVLFAKRQSDEQNAEKLYDANRKFRDSQNDHDKKTQEMKRSLIVLSSQNTKSTKQLEKINGDVDQLKQQKQSLQSANQLSAQQSKNMNSQNETLNSRIGSMVSPIASSFASRRGNELEAVDFWMKSFAPTLNSQRPLPRESYQGLVDCVTSGIYRRLRLIHPGGVVSAAFSPDGSRLITAGHGRYAYIWDIERGEVIQKLEVIAENEKRDVIDYVAYSRDGARIVTASDDLRICLWDATQKNRVLKKPLFERHISRSHNMTAALSEDGRLLATSGVDNTVYLWDIDLDQKTASEKPRILEEKEAGANYAWSIDISHNGKWVATARNDGLIKIWDSSTGKLIYTYKGHNEGLHPGPVHAVHFNNFDTAVYSAGRDITIHCWNFLTGERIHDYPGHQEEVWDLATKGPDLFLASASTDRTIHIWSVRSSHAPLYILNTQFDKVWGVQFSREKEMLATASADHTAEVWQFTTPTYNAIGGDPTSASFSPDGKFVISTSDDGQTHVWEWRTGKHFMHLNGLAGNCYCAAYSHDGQWVATSHQYGIAYLWKIGSYAAYRTITPGNEITPQSPINPKLRALRGQQNDIYSIAYSSKDQYILTAGVDGTARIWDAKTGFYLHTFPGHSGAVLSASFSPNDMQIVTAGKDGSVRTWDVGKNTQTKQFLPPGRKIADSGQAASYPRAAVFSPDGNYILSADQDHNAYLWDSKSGKLVSTLSGHSGAVTAAKFSPDGNSIVTSSVDRSVSMWDVKEVTKSGASKPLYTIHSYVSDVTDVSFSKDGKWITIASRDGTVRVYPSTIEGYIEKARELNKQKKTIIGYAR